MQVLLSLFPGLSHKCHIYPSKRGVRRAGKMIMKMHKNLQIRKKICTFASVIRTAHSVEDVTGSILSYEKDYQLCGYVPVSQHGGRSVAALE